MSAICTSDSINDIAAALAKAQAAMENVAKDRENPHFRARYATLAGVLDEVRPKLAAQGISVLQMPVNGDGSNVGIVTRLLHSSGQWIESALYVAPTKFDAQGVGSALTYLRRYSLMAMAGVGPEDDDGNAAVGKPERAPPRAPVRREAQPTHDNDPFSDTPQAPTSAPLPAPSPEEPPEVAEARAEYKRLLLEFRGAVTEESIEDEKRGIWARNLKAVSLIKRHAGESAVAMLHNEAQKRLDALRQGAAA